MSLALSSLFYSLPAVPSVERRPTAPEVAASNAQNTQVSPRASDVDASETDTGKGQDPYAQIDALLSSLRDLTLGGAKLDSASTTSQANAAYAAYARG
ncbi:hypothetical protein IY145_08635 [Methylosinus sp. H3A]|uniref:hypothetical protein n=1 Tax=Methylosinus sp. H3A TaxID=2785786 RepID=UPI0018C337E1|nr:hypothetical protein [Methylosinus sp. H3A]MBG0809444.1 hypothetical protein [Methylosinus sp. H3A]